MAFPEGVCVSTPDPLYQTIVVGTDGSDRAGIAVRHALALAKFSGAKLHTVQVVHPAVGVGFSDTAGVQFGIETVRGAAEDVKKQLLADADREGVSAEMHNPSGDPAEALIKVAEAVNADLLVLGNRGMTGMTRFVLGSIPNKVSHHAPCSLLIINTDGAE